MKDFLSYIRLTDYQYYLDTITVDQSVVSEPILFFNLMADLTDNKAF
jgi:hypothetical protein